MFVAIANPSIAGFEILELDGTGYSLTGTLVPTTIKTVTIPGGTLKDNGAIRIRAAGQSHGANDAKGCGIGFGAAGFGMGITCPPGDNVDWGFEALVYNVNDDAVQVAWFLYYGGGGLSMSIDSGATQDFTENTANDLDIDVDVTLGHIADSFELDFISVEVFGQS